MSHTRIKISTKAITALAPLADDYLAVGLESGEVQIIDLSGKEPRKSLIETRHPIEALLSFGKNFLCVISQDSLKILDLKSAVPLIFSPDATSVVVGSKPELWASRWDGKIMHFDLQTQTYSYLPDQDSRKREKATLALSREGTHLFAGGESGALRIWDIQRPSFPEEIQLTHSIKMLVCLSESRLLSFSIQGGSKIWSSRGELLHMLHPERTAFRTVLALSSGLLVYGGEQIEVWNPQYVAAPTRSLPFASSISALAELPRSKLAQANREGELEITEISAFCPEKKAQEALTTLRQRAAYTSLSPQPSLSSENTALVFGTQRPIPNTYGSFSASALVVPTPPRSCCAIL